ncbi:hypothetical protein NQ176_g8153 [Zarea fungicola]|uniref:Uncharacterized protein n=1 Tax=Zarea fungicola TaxID=93591 RepID=A0ACC1MVV7_9HYPO|nr:hypothetical protein NQ176_g8153 [Lecanicillium fungicola]
MPNSIKLLALLSLLITPVLSADVPANIRSLYNSIRAKGQCSKILKGGFYSEEGDSQDFSYCGDHLASDGIVYLQGTGGSLANMDINCSGYNYDPYGGQSWCDDGLDSLRWTRFDDIVARYQNGGPGLSPYIHSFITFGNFGTKKGYVPFDPQSVGIEPLSIMAVVCGDKLFYGVWGDGNEDDGPASVGEASAILGRHCYGDTMDVFHSHLENDVLYIAFTGHHAATGVHGANWNATTFEEFQESLQAHGNRLISRIGHNDGTLSLDTQEMGGLLSVLVSVQCILYYVLTSEIALQ